MLPLLTQLSILNFAIEQKGLQLLHFVLIPVHLPHPRTPLRLTLHRHRPRRHLRQLPYDFRCLAAVNSEQLGLLQVAAMALQD